MSTIKATVVNKTSTEEMTEGGVSIGAAHTRTARREGVILTDFDQRRLVKTGRIHVIESEEFVEEADGLQSGEVIMPNQDGEGETAKAHSQRRGAGITDRQEQEKSGDAQKRDVKDTKA